MRTRQTYRVHFVKIHPEFFEEVVAGRKRFEVRRDDRGYRVRDLLFLLEWSNAKGYSGRFTVREIVARTALDEAGFPGYACLEIGEPWGSE
jgi:hypothetical protein